MIAAIYARVSTKDKGQDPENQLRELREFAQRLGYTIYKEYAEHESGGKADRPQFQQLFVDAHQRRFDVLLFWSLDRFSREGTTETLIHLRNLSNCGVQFKSFTEPFLDSTGPFKDAFIAFIAALAKQERVRYSERVRAGQAKAIEKGTKSGKPIGRPALAPEKVEQLRRFRAEGMSIRTISKTMDIPRATVHLYCSDPREK